MFKHLKDPRCIRLNLVPQEPPEMLPVRVINTGIIMSGIFIILLISGIIIFNAIAAGYNSRIAKTRQKIKNIPNLDETYRIASEIKTLKEKLSLSQTAVEQKSSLAGKIGEITKLVPWNVWLNSLSVVSVKGKSPEVISLSGGATSNYLIVNFIRGLENLGWMNKVSMQGSRREQIPAQQPGGQASEYFSFEITCEPK